MTHRRTLRQPDLFTPIVTPQPTAPHAPYQATSETSREAASLIQGHCSRMHKQILAFASSREYPRPNGDRGITRKEVEAALGMKTPTACARLNALEESRKLQKLHAICDGKDKVVTREHCAVYVLGIAARQTDWFCVPSPEASAA